MSTVNPEPGVRARVLAIGHACLDLVTVLDERPGVDAKHEAIDHWLGGGGPAANAAVALRRLGHAVRLLARRGDDEAGRIVDEELGREGVEIAPHRVAGETSIAQIQCVGPARSIVWRRPPLPPLPVPTPEQARRTLRSFDLLYLDGHEGRCAQVYFEAAVSVGLPVVADLGSPRPEALAWPAGLAWSVATRRYLAAWADPASPRAAAVEALARRAQGRPVGLTLGEEGVLALVEGKRLAVPARRVRVVDTTGAGDAFHAGLADAVLQGWTGRRALEWASALGASVCRFPGGRRGLPKDRAQMVKQEQRWPARSQGPDPDRPLGETPEGGGAQRAQTM